MPNSVISGVNNLSADLKGKSVAEVRAMLAQALNIDPESQAVVDGNDVAETYVLAADEELEFVKAAGDKG